MESDELYHDRFWEDVEAVAARTDPEEGRYDELLAVAHPGFTRYHPGAVADVEEGYEAFLDEVTGAVERAVEDERAEVLALYPESWQEVTEEVVGEETIEYVPTEEKSALFVDDGEERVAEQISGLADEGTVRVVGEVNGCCYTHVRQLFEEVEDRIEMTYDVVEGAVYPEERLSQL